MRQIVECVPNFSEGRSHETINSICGSIRQVRGVSLLNAEPDEDYNRSVMTFVGTPEGVEEAAFLATRTAAELIDMRLHSGRHPRIGATDVVPFIPISGITMDDCVKIANRYGERVSRELRIPVYLYGHAARMPHRISLSDIRKGEYEKLSEKLKDPLWKPDYGEPVFNEKSGATVTGARNFLIAYNVNLNTGDERAAHEIASRIRESGRIARDGSGKTVKNEKGETVKIPGSLRSVKAIGVYLQRFDIAQVSMNLTDYETTSMHEAFEEVRKQARAIGFDVTGSELVGLTPLEAILKAGRFYAEGKSLPEKKLVSLAVEKLGLNQLAPFNIREKIIDYRI
jgi:glutamate formiminotransferase/formiminotetrahydrofolate cyclodeaminase